MGFRYALDRVTVTISRGTKTTTNTEGTTTTSDNEIAVIGGNKSMVGSITLSRATERFSAEGDATGGYVINETKDTTGEVVLSLRQFAPRVKTLTEIFNKYDIDSGSFEYAGYGLDSENQGAVSMVVKFNNAVVAYAKGCFLNMPEMSFEEEASDRDFTFVAGEVFFEANFEIGTIV